MLIALAVGAPLVAALLHDDAGPGAEAEGVSAAELARETPRIAREVEAVRGLEFEQVPKPQVIGVAELDHLFRKDYARPAVRRDVAETQAAFEALGLLDPDDDLQEALAGSADAVAGAYDQRNGNLYVISGPTLSNRAIALITLAHELNHALEDQRFGLPDPEDASGDRALAETAFIEGSATSLMTDYAADYIDPGELLSASADPAALGEGTLAEIPEVIREQLLFSYFGGQRMIDAIREPVDRGWNLVDVGLRANLPLSTEQVIHPEKYLRGEEPLPVGIAPGDSPGPGWRRLGTGTFGEFQTRQLLELNTSLDSEAEGAAAGWGGDRYAVWRRGDDTAVLLRTRWDTARDATEFMRAAEEYASALGAATTATRTGPRSTEILAGVAQGP